METTPRLRAPRAWPDAHVRARTDLSLPTPLPLPRDLELLGDPWRRSEDRRTAFPLLHGM